MANAGIYNLANQPTVALQSPEEAAMRRMSYEAAKQQFEDQRKARRDAEAFKALAQESGGDIPTLIGLARKGGMLSQADALEKNWINTQETLFKLDETKRAQAKAKFEDLARAAAWTQGDPQKWAVAAQEHPELGNDPSKWQKYVFQGMTIQQILDQPRKDADQTFEREKFAETQRHNKAMEAKPSGAVQIFSQPFTVTDPTGKPVLVQQDKQGNIRPVSGYSPAAGSDKPMTEVQANALAFGIRARDADAIMNDLESKGVTPGTLVNKTVGRLPIVGNYTKSPSVQAYEQAKENFITAVLRKESGAAISTGEFKAEDQKYFPQPGDSPEVIKQKADARRTAIEVLQLQAGRDLPVVVKPVKPGAKVPTKPGSAISLDDYLKSKGY